MEDVNTLILQTKKQRLRELRRPRVTPWTSGGSGTWATDIWFSFHCTICLLSRYSISSAVAFKLYHLPGQYCSKYFSEDWASSYNPCWVDMGLTLVTVKVVLQASLLSWFLYFSIWYWTSQALGKPCDETYLFCQEDWKNNNHLGKWSYPVNKENQRSSNRSRPLLSRASQLLFLVCWFLCPLFSSLFITALLTLDSSSGFINFGVRVTSPQSLTSLLSLGSFTLGWGSLHPKASLPFSVGTQGWPGRRELTCVLWCLQIQALPSPDQKPTSPGNRRILAVPVVWLPSLGPRLPTNGTLLGGWGRGRFIARQPSGEMVGRICFKMPSHGK